MKSKPFVIGFFAVVVLIAVVSAYIGATVDRASQSISALAAPDGKFKAVKIVVAGGGPAPFCVASISVMLAVYPDDFARREKSYEVFSAPCAQFGNGEPSPKLEWISATALQIVHAASPGAKAARTKSIDVTKSVHVTVVERK